MSIQREKQKEGGGCERLSSIEILSFGRAVDSGVFGD